MRQRTTDAPRGGGALDNAKGLKKDAGADAFFPFIPGARKTEVMVGVLVLLLVLLLFSVVGEGDSEEPDDPMLPSPELRHGGKSAHGHGGPGQLADSRNADVHLAPHTLQPEPLDIDADPEPEAGAPPDGMVLDDDNNREDDGPIYFKRRGSPVAGGRHREESGSDPLDDIGFDEFSDDDDDDDGGEGMLDEFGEELDDLDREMQRMVGGEDEFADEEEDDLEMYREMGDEMLGERGEEYDKEELDELDREIEALEKGMGLGGEDGVLGDVEKMLEAEGGDVAELMAHLQDGEFEQHTDSESEPNEMELEEMADLMFQEMDVNRDNLVSWEEWMTLVARDLPEYDESEERQTFDIIDKNNDGDIDRQEMREDWKREDLQFLSTHGFQDDGALPDRPRFMSPPGKPAADLDGDMVGGDMMGGDAPVNEPLLESNGPLNPNDFAAPTPDLPPSEGERTLGKTLVDSVVKLCGGLTKSGGRFKARAPKPHTLSVKLFQAKAATWQQASSKCGQEGQTLCPLSIITQLRLCQDQDPHHRSMGARQVTQRGGRWTPLGEEEEWVELATCNVNRMPPSYSLQSLVACC